MHNTTEFPRSLNDLFTEMNSFSSNGPLFWSFGFSALTFCFFLQLPHPTHDAVTRGLWLLVRPVNACTRSPTRALVLRDTRRVSVKLDAEGS